MLPDVKVYYEYDFNQERKAPIWYILNFKEGLDWDKKTIYIPISAPFQKIDGHELEHDIGISIEQAELVLSKDKPQSIGIDLSIVKNRARKKGINQKEIKQLIIQVIDIEEVMQMPPTRK